MFGADEEDEGEVAAEVTKDEQEFDESILPITTGHYLYLSGTPFRGMASGEFIEEQIYNWTYSDEQRSKRDWKGPGANPYASLPRLVLMTYTLPDDIRQVAEEGEFNEFDLNEFFLAEGEGNDAKFEHPDEVQKWLDLIRGAYRGTTVDDLKLGKERPPLPFSDSLAGRLAALVLVSAERRVVPCDGEAAESQEQHLLPRLQRRRCGRFERWHRRCGAPASLRRDGRTAIE